jgi:alpha-L-fucosidase
LIPLPSIERLAKVGEWMKVNGESIYETTASPFADQLSFGRATTRGSRVYLHVFEWPSDGKLVVPSWGKTVRTAYLLAGRKKLRFAANGESIVVQTPAKAPDAIASVIALEAEEE